MLTLKKTLPALAVILAFAAHSVTAAELKTSEERESYSMGASVANYIAAQIMKQEALGVKTDKKLVLQGFNDALQNKSKLSVYILSSVGLVTLNNLNWNIVRIII